MFTGIPRHLISILQFPSYFLKLFRAKFQEILMSCSRETGVFPIVQGISQPKIDRFA